MLLFVVAYIPNHKKSFFYFLHKSESTKHKVKVKLDTNIDTMDNSSRRSDVHTVLAIQVSSADKSCGEITNLTMNT